MSGLGGRYTIKLPLTLDKSRHGKYIVNVHLDYRKSLNEANWNNNNAAFSFVAKPLPKSHCYADIARAFATYIFMTTYVNRL